MIILKQYKFALAIGCIFITLAIFTPTLAASSLQVTWSYLKEMALIMPPVFLLMGLLEVWVPKDKIQKWLGSGSKVTGALISLALGTLPTGPLYVAFPMSATLLRKGASITNMVIFLGAWAALKIPQLMVEIKFLGVAFTALRFVLTLSALILMGVLMQFIIGNKPVSQWLPAESESMTKK